MRLLDAEDLSSLRLGKFPLFDDAVYLQRQACLKLKIHTECVYARFLNPKMV